VLSHFQRTAGTAGLVKSTSRARYSPLLSPIDWILRTVSSAGELLDAELHRQLNGQGRFGLPGNIAIVKVPRARPSVIPLASRLHPHRQAFVISLVFRVLAHPGRLTWFPRRAWPVWSPIPGTRDSELWVDDGMCRSAARAAGLS